MLKYFNSFLLLAAIVVFTAACNGGTSSESLPTEPTFTSAPATTESGYPPPTGEIEVTPGYPPPAEIPTVAGYPEPDSGESPDFYATPGPIPEADSSSGVVVGKIEVSNEPIPNLTIYLAEVLVDEDGQERVASYDRENSPRAFTDQNGQFVFSNIRSGNYGLVLDTVLSSYLLHLPQEDTALIITVNAGEVTNIELLKYDSLPLPPNE